MSSSSNNNFRWSHSRSHWKLRHYSYPGNSKELEEAMLKLLPDENLKNSLAEKGFNRIIEQLQWKEAAKLMTESYEAEIKRMTE